MDDQLNQTVQASQALRKKIFAGEIPTAEEYAAVMNQYSQLANELDPFNGLMVLGIISSIAETATNQGYEVQYTQETDTFSVTGGANG